MIRLLLAIILLRVSNAHNDTDTGIDIANYYGQKGYQEIGRAVGVSGISIRILKHPEQPPSNVVWLVSNDTEREFNWMDDFTNAEYEVKLIDGSGEVIPYKKPEFEAGSRRLCTISPGHMLRFEMDLNKMFHGRENNGVIIEFIWSGYNWSTPRTKERQAPISLTLSMEQLGFESPKSTAASLPTPKVEMPQVESSIKPIPAPTRPETAPQPPEHSTFRFWLAGLLGAIGLALLLWFRLRKR